MAYQISYQRIALQLTLSHSHTSVFASESLKHTSLASTTFCWVSVP